MRYTTLLLVGFVACGQPLDQPSVATLDQRASYLAATACDRYDDCQGFSDDRVFRTRDACENDYKTRALKYWPSEVCEPENIDDVRFEACLEQVMQQRCAKDFWDAVKNASECQPSKVCQLDNGEAVEGSGEVVADNSTP